mmetsp:Transcript_28486/g.61051  ORF Transcript_28486/g.61051 Transcript_28486/m.61051 type:complete len:299 (+) Transcript_28486:62-958(+)
MNQARPCQNCGTTPNKSYRCSRCNAVFFCSKDCQKSMWSAHKAFCTSVSQPCPAVAVAVAVAPNALLPTCLIVDGIGPLGPGWNYMKGAKRELLAAGVNVVVVDATRGRKIPEQVASYLGCEAAPAALLVLGWGSADGDAQFHSSEKFRSVATNWCQKGGRFMVQGERIARVGNWPSWFNKRWTDSSYFRTDHKCYADGSDAVNGQSDWYKLAKGAITSRYNVKACMIKNVEPVDILFGAEEGASSYSLVPGFGGQSIGKEEVAIALGAFGQGTVSFFGDVNYEDSTLKIMAIVARGY